MSEGIEALKQAGEIIGNRTRIKVVKNKVAPPFKEAEFDIMFGKGISKEGDVLDLAAGLGIIVKSGAWYAYKDAKIGQGRENAKQYLRDNPEILEEVETQFVSITDFQLRRSKQSLQNPRVKKVNNGDNENTGFDKAEV